MSVPSAVVVRVGESRWLQPHWIAVAVLAVVIDFADGFWATSLHGAVGAIERTQEPFDLWLRSSTLMLPLYVLAVVLAAWVGRRWVGPSRRNVLTSLTVAVLVVVTTTFVGIVELAVNSAIDYHAQSEQLETAHARDLGTNVDGSPHDPAQHAAELAADCNVVCKSQQATLAVHKRAVAYGSVVLLITNAVLAVFLVVLWGVRPWAPWSRSERAPVGNGGIQPLVD